MWDKVVVISREWSLTSMIIRLGMATIVGVVIGADRSMKRRVAGVKTHVLVCLGAAFVMMTSQCMSVYFPKVSDLARMGAQVISGVGFLGVGTIIVTGKNQVRGLTTAAGLWTCACVGLAAGIGYIEGVLLCLLFILFTFKILDRVDMILHKHAKVFDVYLEFDNNKCVAQFREELMMQNLKLTMFEVSPDKARGKGLTALATIEVKERSKRVLLMDILRKMDCLKFVEEI